MKRTAPYVLVILALILLDLGLVFRRPVMSLLGLRNTRLLVTGTANPGIINVYEIDGPAIIRKKTLDTGYRFVHSVRLGNIKNDGKRYIVAGVSNSFFQEPYGCKVIAYSTDTYERSEVDTVGDLRCKDLTVGDLANDGTNEIVLGTHGEGLVIAYKWTGSGWQKTVIEDNFISQIDKETRTNHRVPNTDVPCKTCLIQTAVHIVKIGDIDNDGKNELVTTMSSPLELKSAEEISYIRVYRKTESGWKGETVDSLTGREFRSITIADIRGTGKNTLLVGIGTPRTTPGSLIAYDFIGGSWKKQPVHEDKTELNMKGVDVGSIRDKSRSILLATGFPDGNLYTFRWNGSAFTETSLGSVRQQFSLPNAQYNSMVASFIPGANGSFIVGGNAVFPKEGIGWEATYRGFLISYLYSRGTWQATVLNSRNVLGFDIQ